MIIKCKNCHKKFKVKDNDIPDKGRTVQCGNCSTQWLQLPITPSVTSGDLNVDEVIQDFPKNEFTPSDGKKYKFLGSQWAEVLPSGKIGRLARKKISAELNELAGKKPQKKRQKINDSTQSVNQYREAEGRMGIFSFLIVFIIFAAAVILALDTFKHQLIPFFPNLDNYLVYIFETLNNIYVIIIDLLNNYT